MPNMKQMYEDNAHTEAAYPIVWLPVGTIYENRYDISDEINRYFVGVWERYGNGCTTVGVDESDSDFSMSNKTLGEKTHKLTINEMPNHNHPSGSSYTNSFFYVKYNEGEQGYGSYNGPDPYHMTVQNTVSGQGGGQSHNNIQPSITVYRWVRIS